MLFTTRIDIEPASFQISPCERMLFVGSCFADRIGARFAEERFPVSVNPYGVMYNPASILHTVERVMRSVECGVRSESFTTAVLTLGTNHVYVEKATGEIVDNCMKRPQQLFEERELSVDECAEYLERSISLLREHNPGIRIILTVSPIRYRKYGFHGSQLSKATLLLAIDQVINTQHPTPNTQHPTPNTPLYYFPAYEIVLDELRDYRFYDADMLHPSSQAVEYIWERLVDSCFSPEAKQYLEEWRPVKEALAHRPFNPDSAEYKVFLQKAKDREQALAARYPGFSVNRKP
jgi:hypothetical protein